MANNVKAYSAAKRCSVNIDGNDLHFENYAATVPEALMAKLTALNSPGQILFSDIPFPRESSPGEEAPSSDGGDPEGKDKSEDVGGAARDDGEGKSTETKKTAGKAAGGKKSEKTSGKKSGKK